MDQILKPKLFRKFTVEINGDSFQFPKKPSVTNFFIIYSFHTQWQEEELSDLWAYTAVTSGWIGIQEENKHIGDHSFWLSTPRNHILLFVSSTLKACSRTTWKKNPNQQPTKILNSTTYS